MFGKSLFRSLRSNKPISHAHGPSVHVQQAQKNLQQLQHLAQKNTASVQRTSDAMDKRTLSLLQQNQNHLNRR
jgi:hypothetical protein